MEQKFGWRYKMGFWSRFKKRYRTQARSEAVALSTITEVKAAEEENDAVLETEEGKAYVQNDKGVWVKDQTISATLGTGNGDVLMEYTKTGTWTSINLDWSDKGSYEVIKILMNGQPAGCYRLHGRVIMNGSVQSSGYYTANDGRFSNDGVARSYSSGTSYFYLTDYNNSYPIARNESYCTVGAEITMFRNSNGNGQVTFNHQATYLTNGNIGGSMVGGSILHSGTTGSMTGIQIGSNEGSMGVTKFTVIGYNKIS
jgi:hypothetical protein